VFSQANATCLSRPIFSYSLIHNLFQNVQSIVFSQKKWDGRQTGGIYLWKGNVLRSLESESAACRVIFPQQSLETTRCENIRERDSRWTKYSIPATRTMLNPRTPKSQCFSVRFSKSDVKGWIFFSPIGATSLQVTLTLNFGGEGVVPDRRGFEYFVHLL